MGQALKIHDGKRTAADFRRLLQALDQVLEEQVAQLRSGNEKGFDRDAIQRAFDENGFKEAYFGLDFAAPPEEFVIQLEHVHQDQIPDHILLYETHPDGEARGALISAEPGSGWDPLD